MRYACVLQFKFQYFVGNFFGLCHSKITFKSGLNMAFSYAPVLIRVLNFIQQNPPCCLHFEKNLSGSCMFCVHNNRLL